MENKQIADIFNSIADLLDIEGENPFRIRSYRNAGQVIQSMSRKVALMVRDGARLDEIPGVGSHIAEKIKEIVTTGKCHALEDLQKKFPPGLLDMLKLEGLGPRKVKLLYDELKVDSIDRLEKAALAGRLNKLPGMGVKTEEKILKAITGYKRGLGRFRLADGLIYAEAIINYLRPIKGVKELAAAGSLRRRKETIGDIDILAICADSNPVMDKFVACEGIEEVLAHGKTKSSIKLTGGLHADLRVLEEKSFGAALVYFTGSKEHNIVIRERAKEQGLKVNEYGVFRVKDDKIAAGATEEEVYESLGLPFIPPELRENQGEIEAALKGQLPRLINLKDIRGDLQMHTRDTDGKNTILEMASKARELGYEYMAVTNHSKAVRIAGGLDEEQLARHLEAIDKVNARISGIRILKGIEVDILADGSLDLSDDILKECEVVLAAVHSRFNMPEDEMTRRIIKVFKNPQVDILAHPTGRLILEREPYQVNLKEVMKAAVDNGICLEINAHPARLDLKDAHARLAKEMGVKIVISTDAHAAEQLEVMKYGVFTARRGWIEARDVINTRPLKELLQVFK